MVHVPFEGGTVLSVQLPEPVQGAHRHGELSKAAGFQRMERLLGLSRVGRL